MREFRRCVECNKLYIAERQNAKYCGAKCRRAGTSESYKIAKEKRKAQREAESVKVKRKKESLTNIAVAARQAGMTYGQYVAKMGL